MSITKAAYFWVVLSCMMLAGCQRNVYDRVIVNYGAEVDRLSREFNLPSNYLKALIILESSGMKEVPPRFEASVFNKLVALRAGRINKFEELRTSDILDASDEALKNLASSWGPFQLMGYKCEELGVKVKDIRGEQAVYWSIFWINKNYGDVLRDKRFEDAFRIHNTGRPNGRTYDPNYVSNGLKHMNYFKE